MTTVAMTAYISCMTLDDSPVLYFISVNEAKERGYTSCGVCKAQ